MYSEQPTPVRPRWTKFHQILHDYHGLRYFVAALGIIIATGLFVLVTLYRSPVEQPVDNSYVLPKKPVPKFYSSVTGIEVADEATAKRAVTAIMIENSPDARPQSGLKAAGTVFEAVAEGGITRFLAVYQEAQPGLIGPVRSLRPYYVDWAAAFDASIAHVGGSKKALQEVRNGQYRDIDQFFNPGAYWRAQDRYAPHNVYTNFDRLNALNQKKGYTTSTLTGFPRKAEAASKQPNATKIQVVISGPQYNSSYVYDTPSNSYLRSQAGKPHTDREAGQIQPKNVVVIKVPTSIGMEDGYREQMQSIGTGTAYVFRDGMVTEGTWSKPDKKQQIRFLDAAGKDIPLNPGQTWITAIAPQRSVTWQ